MSYNQYISSLLDEMQNRYDETDDEYKKKILRRIIKLLEQYVG